jgi:3-oxoacyl-ACP reductase-like protein
MDEIQRLRDGHDNLTAAVHSLALQTSEHQVTMRHIATSVESTTRNVDKLAGALGGMAEQLEKRFASKSRFEIVEKVVFGAAGVILLAFLTGLLKLPNLVP